MMRRTSFAFIAIVLAACLAGCSSNKTANVTTDTPAATPTPAASDTQTEPAATETEVIAINVTSETLTPEGKWLTVINSKKGSPAGSNLSPQLSWEPVAGAAHYAIYMVDNSAGYWLHWKAVNVKETQLALGAELEESKYEGPYPPSGIHEYEVIVYALKAAPEKYPGAFDSTNRTAIALIEKGLDSIDGAPGNILGKGSVKGTVTVGETVE